MLRGFQHATLMAFIGVSSSTAIAQEELGVPEEPVIDPAAAPSELTIVVETREPEIVVEPETVPPVEPVDPGTHFILELNLGSSFTGSVGFAGSLLLGAGGKLKGFPPVFYVIGEVGYQRGGSDGQSGDDFYEDGRDYADFSLGLRTYIPLIQDLRLFVDLLAGTTLANATLTRSGFTDLRSNGWYAHFAAGLGVQGRIFRELSAGVRVKILFTDDGLDDFREALGIHTPIPIVASGTVSWHF